MEMRERFRGCLVGLAVGDAIGTVVEFKPRGSFTPLTDMVGGGPFRLKPGQWTDDTSMALCLAVSLVESGGFDARDQMNRYLRWWREGYLSSTGACFDIGTTVSMALRQFEQTGEPYSGPVHPRSAGNGCIMRLAPVPLFFHPDLEKVIHFAGESSRTTHGATECIDACRLLAAMLFRALEGRSKEEVLLGSAGSRFDSDSVKRIARGEYRARLESEVRGSGYVVDCLEAAAWCFDRADSFAEAVLMAANLGDDADTTAAVCGQVAGAHWGLSGIPPRWVELLAARELIVDLADRLLATDDRGEGGGGEPSSAV